MIVSDEQGLGLGPNTMTAEALELPFKCFAVAEKNQSYQETILLITGNSSKRGCFECRGQGYGQQNPGER